MIELGESTSELGILLSLFQEVLVLARLCLHTPLNSTQNKIHTNKHITKRSLSRGHHSSLSLSLSRSSPRPHLCVDSGTSVCSGYTDEEIPARAPDEESETRRTRTTRQEDEQTANRPRETRERRLRCVLRVPQIELRLSSALSRLPSLRRHMRTHPGEDSRFSSSLLCPSAETKEKTCVLRLTKEADAR